MVWDVHSRATLIMCTQIRIRIICFQTSRIQRSRTPQAHLKQHQHPTLGKQLPGKPFGWASRACYSNRLIAIACAWPGRDMTGPPHSCALGFIMPVMGDFIIIIAIAINERPAHAIDTNVTRVRVQVPTSIHGLWLPPPAVACASDRAFICGLIRWTRAVGASRLSSERTSLATGLNSSIGLRTRTWWCLLDITINLQYMIKSYHIYSACNCACNIWLALRWIRLVRRTLL